MVRVFEVLGEANDVVGEGANELASNFVGRVGWSLGEGFCTGKPKSLNHTIEVVKADGLGRNKSTDCRRSRDNGADVGVEPANVQCLQG